MGCAARRNPKRSVAVRKMFSKLVHCAAWLGVVGTAAATAYLVPTVGHDQYGWAAWQFTCMMALPLGTLVLLLGLVPSVALYRRARRRLDCVSIVLTGSALAVLLAEVIAVNIIIPYIRNA